MKIIYTSQGRMYLCEDGKTREIPSERIARYRQNLQDIYRRKEWKTTGTGAQFTQTMAAVDESESFFSSISGVTAYKDEMIYSLKLDNSCGVYTRSVDPADDIEGLILSSNDTEINEIAYSPEKDKLALSLGGGGELHIAVLEPPSAVYDELTDGDSSERYLSFSEHVPGRLYFSTSGNARNEYGGVTAHAPYSGAYIDIETNAMEEVLSDEKYDFIHLKENKDGELWYIKQPYGGEHTEERFGIKDVVLFPVRLLKALGGWLNFMSIIWGGQALNGKDPRTAMNERTKGYSQKDIMIDGNVIKAQKAADKKEEKPVMPHSRVLCRRDSSGGEEIAVKKGILDFAFTERGVVYSDGRNIYSLEDGKEELIAKAFLAENIIICK